MLHLDVLASPDTGEALSLDGDRLVTASGESFPIRNRIIYLLPRQMENSAIKLKEIEGWKDVFVKNAWTVRAEDILALPESLPELYWRKVTAALDFALRSFQDLRGMIGVDLACGMGWAAARFTQKGARMIAADMNDSPQNGLGSAVLIHEKGVAFDAVCMDSERLPIKAASLDFAFICSALHHFTQPVKALRDIHRVLKPGGVLIDIAESFKTGFHDEERDSENQQLIEFRAAGINEQSYTQREYETMFREAGFDLETFLTDWDRPDPRLPSHRWRNGNLATIAKTHRRRSMRALLSVMRGGPLIALLRYRRLHYTVADRVFIARKPR